MQQQGTGCRFEPEPPVLLQDDDLKSLRQTRYLALNPVRSKLVGDPLQWAWSTQFIARHLELKAAAATASPAAPGGSAAPGHK